MKINPYTDKITFGKYEGKTFDEISDIDAEYILWLDENVKSVKIPQNFVDAVEMDYREYWENNYYGSTMYDIGD